MLHKFYCAKVVLYPTPRGLASHFQRRAYPSVINHGLAALYTFLRSAPAWKILHPDKFQLAAAIVTCLVSTHSSKNTSVLPTNQLYISSMRAGVSVKLVGGIPVQWLKCLTRVEGCSNLINSSAQLDANRPKGSGISANKFLSRQFMNTYFLSLVMVLISFGH